MSTDADARQATGPQRPKLSFLVERDDGLKHPTPVHARAFLGLVRAAEHVDRALNADLLLRHGISLRGFEILLHLAVFAPGQLRMGQLTEQAPLSQSRVSRLVGDLERAGYVTRSSAAEDSRGVMVTITEAGTRKLREAQETHFRGLEERLFSRLSDREVVQLGNIAKKILGDEGTLP